MNYDEIVDVIVNEVYSKINNISNPRGQFKKVAVVMKDENLTDIRRILANEYEISVYGNEDTEGDIVIIPALSLGSMANLANLVTDEPAEEFVIRMLMMGKEVYLLENGLEYRQYKNTAPKALYSKYLDFEKQLKINGIQIIGYIGEVKKVQKNLLNTIEPIKTAEIFKEDSSEEVKLEIRNKKVINEAQIRNSIIPGIKTIIIDKKSIITPLAADLIRTHHLKVERV